MSDHLKESSEKHLIRETLQKILVRSKGEKPRFRRNTGLSGNRHTDKTGPRPNFLMKRCEYRQDGAEDQERKAPAITPGPFGIGLGQNGSKVELLLKQPEHQPGRRCRARRN